MNLLGVVSNLKSLVGYIDPAATSVLLSSIVAIAVAIGASAIIIWRKVKNKVGKTFHIDPNAKKEVEDEIVLNDETKTSEENKEVVEEVKVEETEKKPAKKTTKNSSK